MATKQMLAEDVDVSGMDFEIKLTIDTDDERAPCVVYYPAQGYPEEAESVTVELLTESRRCSHTGGDDE